MISLLSQTTSLCPPVQAICTIPNLINPINTTNACSARLVQPATTQPPIIALFRRPSFIIKQMVLKASQGDWVTVFQLAPQINTRADVANLLNQIVETGKAISPQVAHLARILFSKIPYDNWTAHELKCRKLLPLRKIGKASADESLKRLSQSPRKALEQLPSLSTEEAHQLLEWIYARGRLAELELIFEEEFLVHDNPKFEGSYEEWNALEARLLKNYHKPETSSQAEKLFLVALYIGIQTPLSAANDNETSRLSLFHRDPKVARKVWKKAQKDSHYLNYLFQVAQLSLFLKNEGKTVYKVNYNTEISTFVELIATNQGICETFSFLFSSLAPVIGLQVYGGFYPGHAFIHTAIGDLVIETTADFNLRAAKGYKEKSLDDEEFKEATPAYWLIRWRLISTTLTHMVHNKGRWDRRLLMMGDRLFPNDAFFQGSSFQTQLALAHFAQGDIRRARAICRKLGLENIRNDVLLLIHANFAEKGMSQQAKIISDFLDELKKI
ncbi:MAG: hypothetical protein IPJ69_09480 [Deltaproteobacteria bacterium]|nr:MAG: hypothetical protein IPJ69_09480 [Deltaproteobacteria bacterium]